MWATARVSETPHPFVPAQGQSDSHYFVMPALVAGIHVLNPSKNKNVEGRDKPGHDDIPGEIGMSRYSAGVAEG